MEQSIISFTSLLILGSLASCNSKESQTATRKENPGRPNVLFILADDQRADALGCAVSGMHMLWVGIMEQ
jgi:hypothetical protein